MSGTTPDEGIRQHNPEPALPVFLRRALFRESVHTEGEALVYLTECTLATVSEQAMLKSRSDAEYRRQQAMATLGLAWCIKLREVAGSRVADILRNGLTVAQWVHKYEARPAKLPEQELPAAAKVQNTVQALQVLTNETLETVRRLAGKKSRPVNEYRRQQGMAEFGVEWCRQLDPMGTLLLPVGVSVAEWAKSLEAA